MRPRPTYRSADKECIGRTAVLRRIACQSVRRFHRHRRAGANLSRPSDPPDRAVPGRRARRRAGARGRRRDVEVARPAGDRREPRRRGRQHRRRCGRQGGARRLHAADVVGRHPHRQPVPLRQDAVRRRDRVHPGLERRADEHDPGRASQGAGEEPQGVRRARQGGARTSSTSARPASAPPAISGSRC